jgi:hypothetical protein
MASEIITPEDLQSFKRDLLSDISELLEEKASVFERSREGREAKPKEEKAWIKSHQVQRMLGISPGTLQNLRINGTIPYSKVGGVLFYNKKDIEKILENSMRNRDQSTIQFAK